VTCLVGLNGAGKSTVLQAIHLLQYIMSGEFKNWSRDRNFFSIPSKYYSDIINERFSFSFYVELNILGKKIIWRGNLNDDLRCLEEDVVVEGDVVVSVRNGVCIIGGQTQIDIAIDYHGSILSGLKEKFYTDSYPILKDIKNYITNIRSLERLSPFLIRSTEGKYSGPLGNGGEGLTNFIANMNKESFKELKKIIRNLFSKQLRDIRVISEDGNYLYFYEKYVNRHKLIKTISADINDGLLRQLAIISQTLVNNSILLLDELENGIDPEAVEKLVQYLIECPQQVIFTTHSLLIMNYIPDDLAKEGVIFLYRNNKGHIQGVRFFDLPEPKEKLTILGPGEAYVDCYLHDIVNQLNSVTKEEKTNLLDQQP
ncbi:MAG: ATP-binding protein, partial [Magnetococcales bacterium]|nr:ATP-binding protein [Magnetococcales bacterium]